MPRLLILADSLLGGLGSIARFHDEWFSARGWDVMLYGNDGLTVAKTSPIRLPESARDARGMADAAHELREICIATRPDVLHCHGLRSFAVAVLARQRAFVTMHGFGALPGEFAAFRVLRRIALATIPRVALGAFSVGPTPRGSPGWRQLPHASPALRTLQRFELPIGDQPMFLWIGRLDRPKRPDLFVRALALAAEHVRLHGVMIGGGNLEHEIRILVNELNAPIDVVGDVADIDPFLRDAWAVVLISRFEGIPLALEEAMWAGRTVVASPLRGVQWLVGDVGYLVSEVEDIVDALLALSDPVEASHRGNAAAIRARQLFSSDSPWPVLEKAYERFLQHHDSARIPKSGDSR